MGLFRSYLLTSAITAGAAMAAIAPAAAEQAAAPARARFACSDRLGGADASMTARFERQGGRGRLP